MADRDLQDEVERILRRLTLDEMKEIATHMNLVGMDTVDNPRTILRNVQDHFDNAGDADARNLLLRDLPIPEPHLANYQRLWVPVNEQVVPDTNGNIDNAGGADGGGQNVNGGPVAVVGQNRGALSGVGVPIGGELNGGPLGGFAGGVDGGLQAPNHSNAGFPQQNMGQNTLQLNGWQQQNFGGVLGGFQNLGGYQNPAGFQHFGGVQRPQVRGDLQSQNPLNIGMCEDA